MYGPSWVKPGNTTTQKWWTWHAPSPILNVRPPNGCEGRVLSEAMN
jgi:hypothetical protein